MYQKAFWDCSTDRDIGMAEGPIPWSSMDKWARRYGYVGTEFDRLVFIMRSMDSVYITERSKKHKKAMTKGTKSSESKAIATKRK